jgi:hypothetical protein
LWKQPKHIGLIRFENMGIACQSSVIIIFLLSVVNRQIQAKHLSQRRVLNTTERPRLRAPTEGAHPTRTRNVFRT